MQINWFTVIAQVVNFLILVWLLKRFLYKPILSAIDEREKKIVAQIADAEAKKAEADKQQVEYKQKNETFDQEKKGLMDKAVADANVERQKLQEAARNEASALRIKEQKALQDMQDSQNLDIAERIKKEVFDISTKALAGLASASLEEQAANMFIKRLDELKEEEKKQFTEAFKSSSNLIIVRSAFELPAVQQTKIKNCVDKILATGIQYQFDITPALVSGIELTANGYKLNWSIAGYLSSLEKNITGTLKK